MTVSSTFLVVTFNLEEIEKVVGDVFLWLRQILDLSQCSDKTQLQKSPIAMNLFNCWRKRESVIWSFSKPFVLGLMYTVLYIEYIISGIIYDI